MTRGQSGVRAGTGALWIILWVFQRPGAGTRAAKRVNLGPASEQKWNIS